MKKIIIASVVAMMLSACVSSLNDYTNSYMCVVETPYSTKEMYVSIDKYSAYTSDMDVALVSYARMTNRGNGISQGRDMEKNLWTYGWKTGNVRLSMNYGGVYSFNLKQDCKPHRPTNEAYFINGKLINPELAKK